MEVHYYVYDDPNHDSLFVQHAFMLRWQYLQNANYTPRQHIVWTNGCLGQFNNTHAWYFVSWYLYLTTYNSNPNGCSLI
jgi:hypothetical protein